VEKFPPAFPYYDATGDICGTSKLIWHRGGIEKKGRYAKRRDIVKSRKLQVFVEVSISGSTLHRVSTCDNCG
jgi:hypothetical protein